MDCIKIGVIISFILLMDNNALKIISLTTIALIVFIILTIIISWLINLNVAYKLHQAKDVGKHNQDKCGEFFLEGETSRNLIYEKYKEGIEQKQKNITSTLLYMFLILITIVWIVSIIVLYIIVTKRGDKNICDDTNFIKLFKCKKFIFSAVITLLYTGTFIVSVISRSKLNDKLSFLIGSVSEKKTLIGNQLAYMLSILGYTMVVYLIYRFYILKGSENVDNISHSMLLIIVANILLAIFTPIMSGSIFKLNKNINEFYYNNVVSTDDSSSLNSLIQRDYIINDALYNHLRINIQRLEDLNELPMIDDEYKDKLYKYVMHTTNMAELRNIVVPEILYQYIEKKYLQGEGLLILKEDLLKYYNGTLNSSNIKKYLKSNLTNNEVKTFNDLLKKYVKTNDTYKMSNSITSDIRNKLLLLRQNTSMEKTVDEYYKSMKKISFIIFVIGFYIIFHNLYNSNDKFRQIYSFVILFIMIFFGFIGWAFKQLWL